MWLHFPLMAQGPSRNSLFVQSALPLLSLILSAVVAGHHAGFQARRCLLTGSAIVHTVAPALRLPRRAGDFSCWFPFGPLFPLSMMLHQSLETLPGRLVQGCFPSFQIHSVTTDLVGVCSAVCPFALRALPSFHPLRPSPWSPPLHLRVCAGRMSPFPGSLLGSACQRSFEQVLGPLQLPLS